MFVVAILLSIFVAAPKPSLIEHQSQVKFSFVAPQATFTVGKSVPVDIELAVVEKDAYIHPEAPLKVTTQSSEFKISKSEFGHKDAKVTGEVGKLRSLRFPLSISPLKSGKFTLDAKAEFYYCTEKLCVPKQEKTSLTVTVTEAK